MTSLVFDAARRAVEHHSSLRAAGIGLVAVLLVIFLVVEREMLRGIGGARSETRVRATEAIVFPLLVTFVFILGVRFGRFI